MNNNSMTSKPGQLALVCFHSQLTGPCSNQLLDQLIPRATWRYPQRKNCRCDSWKYFCVSHYHLSDYLPDLNCCCLGCCCVWQRVVVVGLWRGCGSCSCLSGVLGSSLPDPVRKKKLIKIITLPSPLSSFFWRWKLMKTLHLFITKDAT